jgi:hypothetical protein
MASVRHRTIYCNETERYIGAFNSKMPGNKILVKLALQM